MSFGVKGLDLGWAPTHQNWCRVLSVFKVRKFWMSVFVGFCRFFCRIFVGFLQQYLKHIFLKIYESSQQKRLCSIHNLDQSVFGQSLSGLRQNAASVDCIREGFFYKNILYYYKLGIALFLKSFLSTPRNDRLQTHKIRAKRCFRCI